MQCLWLLHGFLSGKHFDKSELCLTQLPNQSTLDAQTIHLTTSVSNAFLRGDENNCFCSIVVLDWNLDIGVRKKD